jgi:hypothetical protein
MLFLKCSVVSRAHCTFDALGLAFFSECKDGWSAMYMDVLEKNIEKLFGV